MNHGITSPAGPALPPTLDSMVDATKAAIQARRLGREVRPAEDLITTTTLDDDGEQHLAIRSLLEYSTERKSLDCMDLGELHAHAESLERILDPRDVVRSLDQTWFEFLEGGKATLTYQGTDGEFSGDKYLLTETALRQLAARTGGKGWGHAMATLAGTGGWEDHGHPVTGEPVRLHTGRTLAESAWNHVLLDQGKAAFARTINVPGQDRRVIRSVHGGSYFAFDGVDLLDVLMRHPVLGGMPVAQCKITDDSTLITILLDPESPLRFKDGGHVMLDEPVPMLRAKTNSVGEGSVCLWGGLFEGFCTNALPVWRPKNTYSWRHQGTGLADRIVDQMAGSIESILIECSDTARGYRAARATAVVDAAFLLREWSRNLRITRTQVDRTIGALINPDAVPSPHITSREYGAENTLAQVVDALTFAAQSEPTIDGQNRLEMAAAGFMHRGLNHASSTGRIEIVPPPTR